jgi:mRNA interferase MazF
VVQSDLLPLSTKVLVEQTAAVDPQRLGGMVGHLTPAEMAAVDSAVLVLLGLTH